MGSQPSPPMITGPNELQIRRPAFWQDRVLTLLRFACGRKSAVLFILIVIALLAAHPIRRNHGACRGIPAKRRSLMISISEPPVSFESRSTCEIRDSAPPERVRQDSGGLTHRLKVEKIGQPVDRLLARWRR